VISSVDDVSWPFSLFFRKSWEDAVVYMNDLDQKTRQHPEVLEYVSELTREELIEQSTEAFSLLQRAFCAADVASRVEGVSSGWM
jgi:hypothetical protein